MCRLAWVGVSNAAVIALIALLACGAGYASWRHLERWLRRGASHRAPCLRHPVVLAHGLFGFDVVDTRGVRREYFQGVSDRLRAAGCTVHRARVAPVAAIPTRAQALAEFVLALPHRKVNIIAHSMGGLDARYAIARLGLGSRVASLTTIGTPHQGTPLADVGLALIDQRLGVGRVLERLGVELEAFHDLTTARAAQFNSVVPDVRGVAYASVVGVVRRKTHAHPLLLASWLYLLGAAGANDGVVPASSQLWGDLLAEIDADHWAQIGRSSAFDASAFYEQLVRELRGRGF